MGFRFASALSRALFVVVFIASPGYSQPDAPARPVRGVVYRVSTAEVANHTLSVEASYPRQLFSEGQPTLALPVWTPGSYKVRDYSKSLAAVELIDGGSARLRKSAKNRWTVDGELPTGPTLKVRYTVYGHELTVRTNYFSPDLGLLIGAATFLAPVPLDSKALEPTQFRVEFPDLDQPVSSSLERVLSAEIPTFVAADYDELIDSPILFGDISEHPFEVEGKPHALVQAGDTRFWDLAKSLADIQKIVAVQNQFWGQLPYDHYKFMNLVTDTRGGLEHLDSTVMMTSRFATQDREAYLDWLSLVCHEYFHAWNVKRLRPKALGPFRYEEEVYTPSLWVAEGITSYYDDLLIRRAGLSSRAEYLKALSGQLNTLWSTPGRKSLPLTEASQDAWIRLYQPTDNSLNDSISYYNKGAVVAWLLDTEIRRHSKGSQTLDSAMRQAYATFAENGYEESEFRALISRAAGVDLSEFFARSLDSTEELDLRPALDYWGLEWAPEDRKTSSEPYFGVVTSKADGRSVEAVAAGSPASQAGLAPGDELLAIEETRVPPSGPGDILKHLKSGQSYTVLVSRLGRLKSFAVTLSAQPNPKKALKPRTGQGAYPKRIDDWLGPELDSKKADEKETTS